MTADNLRQISLYLCIDASSLCNSGSVAAGGTVIASRIDAPLCIAACLAAGTDNCSQQAMDLGTYSKVRASNHI